MANILTVTTPVFVTNISVGDLATDRIQVNTVAPGENGGMPLMKTVPQFDVPRGTYKIGDAFVYTETVTTA